MSVYSPEFLVFDYDGVIIDSAPAVHEAVLSLYEMLGFPAPPKSTSLQFIGPNMADSAKRTREALGIEASRQEELEQFYFDAYVGRAAAMTKAYDGMLELLAEIAVRHVPRAVATMKAQSELDAIGSPLPGLQYFDFVACPPTHIGGSKKDLVGQAVAHLAAVAPAAEKGLMIGDRAGDIHAGAAHGLRTIAVTWGAGTEAELISAHPDEIVRSVAELRELLLST